MAIGDSEHRRWEDCRKYGFVAAGGKKWYSQTLRQLFPGARVFAYIPDIGYVGVGIVKENVVRVKEFMVKVQGVQKPILQVPLAATAMDRGMNNPEESEYLTRVEWIKTVSIEKAYRERGMFANQNTVCKLRSQFTLEKLVKHFGLEE